MNDTNKPYRSALINASLVEERTEIGNDEGYYTPPKEHCGYTLIDGHLVPETFIQVVAEQISNCTFDYGLVLDEADLFDQKFLDTLDEKACAVLMPVVLLLVARDKFPLNLWALTDDEKAAQEIY